MLLRNDAHVLRDPDLDETVKDLRGVGASEGVPSCSAVKEHPVSCHEHPASRTVSQVDMDREHYRRGSLGAGHAILHSDREVERADGVNSHRGNGGRFSFHSRDNCRQEPDVSSCYVSNVLQVQVPVDKKPMSVEPVVMSLFSMFKYLWRRTPC